MLAALLFVRQVPRIPRYHRQIPQFSVGHPHKFVHDRYETFRRYPLPKPHRRHQRIPMRQPDENIFIPFIGEVPLPEIKLPPLPEIKLPPLPEIKLPPLPQIRLPEIKLPEIRLPWLQLLQ